MYQRQAAPPGAGQHPVARSDSIHELSSPCDTEMRTGSILALFPPSACSAMCCAMALWFAFQFAPGSACNGVANS